MPRIAISYRRSDSSAITGRIFDRLVARYGKESVFMDVDNIPIGTDFRSHIRAVLQESEVLIVVIGPRWLGVDAAGAARMSQETDPVRAEVEAAQAQALPMIPVLVDGARMPDSTALPASIEKFAFLNAAEVATGRDFHPHMDRLIAAIEETLGARAGAGAARPYAATLRIAAGHGHGAAPQSWPVDLAVYLIVPIVILLVAHYVIAYALDIDYGYLRLVSIAVPFAFGFLLFWLAGRGAVAAIVIAVALGVVAVSGMTVSDGLNSGQPILPETRVEWRDNIVIAVSIALSFVAGHALIPVGMVLRRKIGKT